ncbi:MAG: CotH kinase family protein [Oscillospiraceae bacterium]|nr:CotH kinase family protein [Oscillospiraceae bacterium]
MKRVMYFTFIVACLGIISGCSDFTGLTGSLKDLSTNWDAPKGSVSIAEAKQTGLPVIYINTENKQPITSKETYLNGTVEIYDSVDSDNNLPKTDTQIRGRGNASWLEYGKKPYRLKFIEKQKLFGRTKAKSWVLLANAADKTLLRNTIAFEMGRRFDLPFTNHYIPVELVLNGEHRGSYLLTEQVQTGKGRVDIVDDYDGVEDIADEYLVELDNYYDEEPKFRTATIPFPVMIKTPETEAIKLGFGDNFVKESLNEFVDTLFADSFPNNGYRDLIDTDTFVKYIMVQEYLQNGDFWLLNSVYLYKNEPGEAHDKISAGPIWDMSNTIGNPNERRPSGGKKGLGSILFERFFDDPAFSARYKELWDTYNSANGKMTTMPTFIDEQADKLAKSWQLDRKLWEGVDYGADYYKGTIIADLQSWWQQRIAFMNGVIK